MNQSANNTSPSLIEELRHGDPLAWERFDERYRNYILSILRKMSVNDACEDLGQRVMVRVWQGLPRYEYRPGQARFRAWQKFPGRYVHGGRGASVFPMYAYAGKRGQASNYQYDAKYRMVQ